MTGQVDTAGRPLLFYSQWPLGYHNPEADLKAHAFASWGFEVVHVPGVGLRNPRPSSLRKLADRGARKLRHAAAPRRPDPRSILSTASVLVLPPRQLRTVRRLNAAWLERQLARAVPSWEAAVAWVRFVTPELVDALRRRPPLVTVYECTDAYRHTPGMTGRWAEVFERAERDLVACADAVVAPSEPLAERFRAWDADVRLIPHGVNVDLFPAPDGRSAPAAPITIGFIGTLDYRLDGDVLRHIAERHADWRIRLVGPIQEGFDPGAFRDLPNLTVEGPLPYERVGTTLASFDAGIMPYFVDPLYTHMCPLKNLELLAVGKPAVARPTPALRPYSELLYFAETPTDFVRQLEAALSEDGPERARTRRSVAEANTWDRRLAQIRALLRELVGRKAER